MEIILVSNEWLKSKIASDRDVDTEAGLPLPLAKLDMISKVIGAEHRGKVRATSGYFGAMQIAPITGTPLEAACEENYGASQKAKA